MRRGIYWTSTASVWLYTVACYMTFIDKVEGNARFPVILASILSAYILGRALLVGGRGTFRGEPVSVGTVRRSTAPSTEAKERKEASMATFHSFEGAGEHPFRFRLDSGDGHTLSSEGYASKDGRDNGIRSVRENSRKDDQYERRVSGDGRPYFVLKALNHEIIGTSRLYGTEGQRDEGIESLKRTSNDADVSEAEKEA